MIIMSLEQRKVKFKPRIKLNHNICEQDLIIVTVSGGRFIATVWGIWGHRCSFHVACLMLLQRFVLVITLKINVHIIYGKTKGIF